MIKNVVFDFGQVIVRFDPEYICSRFVSDKEDVRLLCEVAFSREYWDCLDRGTLREEELCEKLREHLPERLWEAGKRCCLEWIYCIPELCGARELLTKLRREGYRLYLLSNISLYFASHEKEFPILELFDGRVYSSVCGLAKPDRRIFEFLCDKYSLLPEQTLFVDDREDNVEAARAFGIDAYRFNDDFPSLEKWISERRR